MKLERTNRIKKIEDWILYISFHFLLVFKYNYFMGCKLEKK
jgi:hypothetical protein